MVAFGGLTFATFLAYNASLAQKMQHSQEAAGGRFLGRYLEDGEGAAVYGPEVASKHLIYYLPLASIRLRYAADLRADTAEEVWSSLLGLIDEYLAAPPGAGPRVLELSQRWQEPFRRFLGIDPTADSRWRELPQRLQGASRVYDNGLLAYYIADTPRGGVPPVEAVR